MPRGIKLSELEERILEVISAQCGGISTPDIVAVIGHDREEEIKHAIYRLRYLDIIARKTRGPDRRIKWKLR